MRYCLNPLCQTPQNSDQANFCQTCGFKLALGDRYYAIHPIGQGGFGKTFLAIDDYKPSKPCCVIKQSFPLARSHITPEKAAQLFQQEAMRLEELGQHPQIPELLAYFQQDGYQYLVQEFIDGWTLDQELKQNGVFSNEQIWQVLNDLLPVLQFVHDHQVIHRDIKPANIIRRHRDRLLVLVDFGAAKCTANIDLLTTGTSIGSPAFAAPEQAMGKATFASDLYSLGVTCIYLLTQVKPSKLFNPEEGNWVWRPHLHNPLDPRLGQVLDRLLEGATKTRYHTASEALQDLPTSADSFPPSDLGFSPPLSNPPLSSPPLASVPPSSPAWNEALTQRSASLTSAPAWQQVETLTGHTHWVRSVAISPDSRFIVSGSGDRTVRLWDLATGQLHHILKGHNHWVRSIAISWSGQLIASGSNDRSVKIWRLNTGELLHTLAGHSDWVRSVAFSPNHKWVISSSQDKTVKIWQLGTGELIQTLKGHDHWVLAIATAPAPKSLQPQQPWLLASASRDQTIQLWNLKTATPFCTLNGHLDAVNAIAFSPDGRQLISGSQDGTIKIWQVETGHLLRTLTDHTAAITTVAVSADGELLISGSQDRTVRIWQLATGRWLQTIDDLHDWVWSVAISPDSTAIVGACGDGNLRIWRHA